MAGVLRTAEARLDLLEIWLYVAEASVPSADRLLARIDSACRDAARMPGMGRPRDDVSVGLRSLVVGRYVVFYRTHANGITLIRVLHGARDIESVLAEEDEKE